MIRHHHRGVHVQFAAAIVQTVAQDDVPYALGQDQAIPGGEGYEERPVRKLDVRQTPSADGQSRSSGADGRRGRLRYIAIV
jgi:hypothetical protein